MVFSMVQGVLDATDVLSGNLVGLFLTPARTGHNFPYETPEFAIDVIRKVLAETGGWA